MGRKGSGRAPSVKEIIRNRGFRRRFVRIDVRFPIPRKLRSRNLAFAILNTSKGRSPIHKHAEFRRHRVWISQLDSRPGFRPDRSLEHILERPRLVALRPARQSVVVCDPAYHKRLGHPRDHLSFRDRQGQGFGTVHQKAVLILDRTESPAPKCWAFKMKVDLIFNLVSGKFLSLAKAEKMLL